MKLNWDNPYPTTRLPVFGRNAVATSHPLAAQAGLRSGEITERLYREIRALRIYEGATEVQKLIIGRELMKAAAK